MKNTYSAIEAKILIRGQSMKDVLYFGKINDATFAAWLSNILTEVSQAAIDAVIPKEAIYSQNIDLSNIEAEKFGWNLCRDQAIKNAEEFMSPKK